MRGKKNTDEMIFIKDLIVKFNGGGRGEVGNGLLSKRIEKKIGVQIKCGCAVRQELENREGKKEGVRKKNHVS